MIKPVFLLFGLCLNMAFLMGCTDTGVKPDTSNTPVPVIDITASTKPALTYKGFLDDVKASPKSKAALFTYLDVDMPSYWDNTTWDFHGMSRIAGEGEIACGYFVTTLLKDLGFEIDRIRLAQEPSGVMIEALTVDINISNSVEDMLVYIETQPTNSIFIVGLDFHTGFITHSDAGTFFIHSNYINREGVVREPAATSLALDDSGYFMIGNLTTNPDLVRIWPDQ